MVKKASFLLTHIREEVGVQFKNQYYCIITMELPCKNGKKIDIEKYEDFMRENVKNFEAALNECGIRQVASVNFPTHGGLPQGQIIVYEHEESGAKIATNNDTSREVVIAVDRSTDGLLRQVRDWFVENSSVYDDEVAKYMLTELEAALSKKHT